MIFGQDYLCAESLGEQAKRGGASAVQYASGIFGAQVTAKDGGEDNLEDGAALCSFTIIKHAIVQAR